MELHVIRTLKGEAAVKAHPLFGKAVFLECGYYDPVNYCYEHHNMPGEATMLSIVLQVQKDMILRRKMPIAVVCNHTRHFDNLMAMYLLRYRSLAIHPDTQALVAAADLIDRVGPLALSAIPQLIGSVLAAAQDLIPFKEFDLEMHSDDQIRDYALQALESLRGMVAREIKAAKYQLHHQSNDLLFAIVESNDPINNTLYDEGRHAYAAFTKAGDHYKFTLCKASDYVEEFDISACYSELNVLEAKARSLTQDELKAAGATWGGRSTVGGSPKDGTRLTLEKILEVLKANYRG